ncbi:hypothetical protein D3C87_847930 [compost metagenome]
MTERTYAYNVRCPKCWGAALFTNAVPQVGVPWRFDDFYDRHGGAPVPGPGRAALCPLCGGYLQGPGEQAPNLRPTQPHEDPRRAH